MSGRAPGESFVLKHRLAGAAVLIGFAVIVLPLLLGGPREEAGGTDSTESREPDTKVFRSNITPIGGETPTAEAREGEDLNRTVGELLDRDAPPPGDGAPAPDTTAVTNGDVDDEPDRTNETDDGEVETAARDEDAGGTESATTPEREAPREIDRGWIVQVGTFTKPGNVDKLVARLNESGFEASTTEVETSEGSATRVWVGPYETRVEAARMKTRVGQQTGSEALIVAYP